MIRLDDKVKFEYLLKRGILPSAANSEGFNALHFAIRMKKIEHLAFMLEGDYHAFEMDVDLNSKFNNLNNTTNISFNKSQMNFSHSVIGSTSPRRINTTHILDSLVVLDKSSIISGITLFHEATRNGYMKILQYLIRTLKKRNELI